MKQIYITKDFVLDEVEEVGDRRAEQVLSYSNGSKRTSGKAYVVENKNDFINLVNKKIKSDIKEINKEIKQLQNRLRKLKVFDIEEIADEINWE